MNAKNVNDWKKCCRKWLQFRKITRNVVIFLLFWAKLPKIFLKDSQVVDKISDIYIKGNYHVREFLGGRTWNRTKTSILRSEWYVQIYFGDSQQKYTFLCLRDNGTGRHSHRPRSEVRWADDGGSGNRYSGNRTFGSRDAGLW